MTSVDQNVVSALPTDYYSQFLSEASKSRKPSPIRGLFPLENIPGMISLLAGKPAPETFPINSISVNVQSPYAKEQETTVTIEGKALAEALQYGATKGIPSMQKWIYGLQEVYHKRRDGEGWTVTVGSGSQDLLCKAFQALLNPGDPIFIEAPVYGGVIPILESLKCELIEIPTDADGICTSDLRKTLESWPTGKPMPGVIYTVPYGCNPSGTTASMERRKELLALARQYDFLIMEDDPYYFIYYGDAARPDSYFAMEAQDGEAVGRVIRFDSLSKVMSAGLRLGFMSGPAPIVDAVVLHTTSANLQTSSTTQAIAVALLEYYGYDGFQKHAERVSQFYRDKRDVFEAAMKKHLDGLAEWSTPVSGMFLWFKLLLRGEGDSESLIRQKAVEKGVLALPGTAFFPNGQKTAYVRASFSLLGADEVDEALRRLACVIKEYNAQ